MVQPNKYREIDTPTLWEMVFETMTIGLEASDGISAPVEPFRLAHNLLDELTRRGDLTVRGAEFTELRLVIDKALAGESGGVGHA